MVMLFTKHRSRYNLGKLKDPLNELILKGNQFSTVIRFLNIVFICININFVINKLDIV